MVEVRCAGHGQVYAEGEIARSPRFYGCLAPLHILPSLKGFRQSRFGLLRLGAELAVRGAVRSVPDREKQRPRLCSNNLVVVPEVVTVHDAVAVGDGQRLRGRLAPHFREGPHEHLEPFAVGRDGVPGGKVGPLGEQPPVRLVKLGDQPVGESQDWPAPTKRSRDILSH